MRGPRAAATKAAPQACSARGDMVTQEWGVAAWVWAWPRVAGNGARHRAHGPVACAHARGSTGDENSGEGAAAVGSLTGHMASRSAPLSTRILTAKGCIFTTA
jgi:hypothetical protein